MMHVLMWFIYCVLLLGGYASQQRRELQKAQEPSKAATEQEWLE
jgi:hypothetical protein